jgi:DNA-binding CsgD family transcriptional regulator
VARAPTGAEGGPLEALGGYPYTLEVAASGDVLRVLHVSPRFSELVGSADVPLGYLELVAYVHPEDRVGPYPASVLVGGRWHAELRATGADGVARLIWDVATCRSRDPETGVTVWDGVLFDVTERRQAHAVAARAADRMDAALTAVQAAVIEFELPRRSAPRVAFASGSAHRLLDLDGPVTFDALLGVLHAEDRPLLRRHLEALRSGQAVDGEYRLSAPGAVRRLRVRLAPRAGHGHQRAVGLVALSRHPPSEGSGIAPRLTPRQREILARIAAGRRTREIADELSLSPATVRNHTTAILAALQARSRLEAVSAARQAGLL